jgi:Tfp pilus assembly protein FimV
MSTQTLSPAPVIELDRPPLRRLGVVPVAEMFETLVIRPAPAFPRTPLRLVELPARPAARPIERAEPNPLKLTRRGRLALVVVAFLCMAFGFLIAPSFSFGSVTPTPAPSGYSVVVQPGDTLWAIATRAEPKADPRVTVQKIIDLNKLSSTELRAGQTLSLPS